MIPSSISKSISKEDINTWLIFKIDFILLIEELQVHIIIPFIFCSVHVNKNKAVPYGFGLYFILILIIQLKIWFTKFTNGNSFPESYLNFQN